MRQHGVTHNLSFCLIGLYAKSLSHESVQFEVTFTECLQSRHVANKNEFMYNKLLLYKHNNHVMLLTKWMYMFRKLLYKHNKVFVIPAPMKNKTTTNVLDNFAQNENT